MPAMRFTPPTGLSFRAKHVSWVKLHYYLYYFLNMLEIRGRVCASALLLSKLGGGGLVTKLHCLTAVDKREIID